MYIRIFLIIFITLQTSCSFRQQYPNEIIPEGEPSISAQAHFLAGLIEENNLNWRNAALHFDQALRMGESNVRIYVHLARSLAYLTKYQECITLLQNAEEIADKNDYLIWFDIGEMYHILNIKERAKTCYEKSITIYPLFEKASYALNELDKI